MEIETKAGTAPGALGRGSPEVSGPTATATEALRIHMLHVRSERVRCGVWALLFPGVRALGGRGLLLGGGPGMGTSVFLGGGLPPPKKKKRWCLR